MLYYSKKECAVRHINPGFLQLKYGKTPSNEKMSGAQEKASGAQPGDASNLAARDAVAGVKFPKAVKPTLRISNTSSRN